MRNIITLVANPMSQQRPLSVKDTGYVASAFCSVALFTHLHIYHIYFSSSKRIAFVYLCIVCLSHKYLLDRLYPFQLNFLCIEVTFVVTVLTQSQLFYIYFRTTKKYHRLLRFLEIDYPKEKDKKHRDAEYPPKVTVTKELVSAQDEYILSSLEVINNRSNYDTLLG